MAICENKLNRDHEWFPIALLEEVLVGRELSDSNQFIDVLPKSWTSP
jgi:hypothetical protein